MKKLLTLAVLFLFPAVVLAEETRASASDAATKAEILRQVEARLQAQNAKILAEVKAMLDEAFGKPETTTAATTEAKPGFLGVQGKDGENGVEIVQVVPNTPAQAAGLAAGDVIQSVNGKKVTTQMELAQALMAIGAGNEVRLGLRKVGAAKANRLKVVLANRSDYDEDGEGDEDEGEEGAEGDEDGDGGHDEANEGGR